MNHFSRRRKSLIVDQNVPLELNPLFLFFFALVKLSGFIILNDYQIKPGLDKQNRERKSKLKVFLSKIH